jgi:hypothetical protein
VLSVVPCGQGTTPPFIGQRGGFTSVPHCFINVWRHGVQCRRVDGRPGESRFWRDVMACPISVQERLRGRRCRGCPFSGRPRADSRVPLTRGHTGHSSGCGDVLSLRVPTSSGMALQWLGWSHRADGDDGDAPDVTTWPRASAEQAFVPLRGFRRPISRVQRSDRTGVGGTVPRG